MLYFKQKMHCTSRYARDFIDGSHKLSFVSADDLGSFISSFGDLGSPEGQMVIEKVNFLDYTNGQHALSLIFFFFWGGGGRVAGGGGV